MARGARKARPERLSQRALARRLGVDPKAVRKAIASGRLKASIGRDGKLDAAVAAKEWAAGASKPNPRAPGGQPAAGRGGPTLTEAQRRVALERAASIRLSNRQKRAQLVPAAEVRRDAFAAARSVRDAVLGVADRVASELAAESDPARVHARLLEELRGALVVAIQVIERGDG